MDAFTFESHELESLYVKYDPTEWYWDKRLWTIELVNCMFNMKEDEKQYFGIKGGDKIKEMLEIVPEESHEIILHELNDSHQKDKIVSMTLDNLLKGQTKDRSIGCKIHKWKKFGLYELILRRCKYDNIQKTVINMKNDIEVESSF